MSYFRSRYRRSCAEASTEYSKQLANLPYDQLVRERGWFESLSKMFDDAKRLGLIPQEMTKDELNNLICAYRKAVQRKERKILKSALARGR